MKKSFFFAFVIMVTSAFVIILCKNGATKYVASFSKESNAPVQIRSKFQGKSFTPQKKYEASENDNKISKLIKEGDWKEAEKLFTTEPGNIPTGFKGTLTFGDSILQQTEKHINDINIKQEIRRFILAQSNQDDPEMGAILRAHLIQDFGLDYWNREGVLIGWDGSQVASFASKNDLSRDQIIKLALAAETYKLSGEAWTLSGAEIKDSESLKTQLMGILGNKVDKFYNWNYFDLLFPAKISLEY